MNELVKLVTSIAPRNIENQQRAIDSWLRLGFCVTSLNIESEISELSPLFKDVEFCHVSRDARAECGKPLVYLDDVFAYLREKGSTISGIVNSDIHFRAEPETIDFILEQARGSMVIACRADVEKLEDPVGKVFRQGFDVFIFDKVILDSLPATRFCLGQPWWDYWFSLSGSYISEGYPLKFLVSPFAVHIQHEVNWRNSSNFHNYGMHFAKYMNPTLYKSLCIQSPDEINESIGLYCLEVWANILHRSTWLSHVPKGQGTPVSGS